MNGEISHEEILNGILSVLNDNYGKELLGIEQLEKKLRLKLSTKLKNEQIEIYLSSLKDKGYIKSKIQKIPKTKGSSYGGFSYDEYYITENGIEYIKNDFKETQKPNVLSDIALSVSNIDKNTAETNEILPNQGKTIDMILNAMGEQHQKSMRELISANGYLKEYLDILKDNLPDKENKIKDFFKKLSGDLAIEVIKESIKYII